MPHDASPAPTATARRALRRRRAWLLGGVALLYLASVPWYRGADDGLELWLGLPSWVTVAVLCYAGAAVLNALAWLVTAVEDDGGLPSGLAERDGRELGRQRGDA